MCGDEIVLRDTEIKEVIYNELSLHTLFTHTWYTQAVLISLTDANEKLKNVDEPVDCAVDWQIVV